MTSANTHDVLQRLLAIHGRSFPRYLAYADPWTHAGDKRAMEAFQHIVADQELMIDRIGAMLVEEGRPADPGPFPMEFTSVNFLSLDYLIRRAIGYQTADVGALAQCAQQLHLAPAAKAVAEEALGLAKGHLETLQEINSTPVSDAI
jgi:hypothetical protein